MKDFKYTKDGKKVAVIGKLNSQETIVQEIFVTDGGEIPAGEQFIVRGLLDAPAVSWKEKDLETLEKKYTVTKSRISDDIGRLNKQYKKDKNYLRGLIHKTKEYSNIIDGSELQMLVDFLSGNITHVAIANYNYEIKTLKDELVQADSYDGGELKLITLFGKANGGLNCGINRYSDGSGSYHTVFPCTSLEDARQTLEDQIILNMRDGVPTQAMIDAKDKYELQRPSAEEEIKFYDQQIGSIEKNISRQEDTITKQRDKIDDMKAKMKPHA